MENCTFFSILVPVYNVEKYLNQCIESIIAQTYPKFEIILLDDGSSDSSGTMCDNWIQKDSRIKVFHRENKGLFQTRLDEIDVASGDYLVFVDSDDYVKPELLDTLSSIIQEYSPDIVTYGRTIVDCNSFETQFHISAFPDGTKLTAYHRNKVLYRALQNNDITSIWSKCVKRSLIQPMTNRLREYGRVNMGEDLIFSTWLFSRYSLMIYTDFPLYCYRRDGSGMSTRSNFKYFNDTITCSMARYDAILSIKNDITSDVIKLYWERQWHGKIYFLKSYLLQGIGAQEYSYCYITQQKMVSDGVFSFKILFYKLIYLLMHPIFYPILRKVFQYDYN